MGRAFADAQGAVRGFSDPVALRLLPDDCRASVERLIRGAWPRSRRDALLGLAARAAARLMGPRTAEIDDGLRALTPGHQLVIVGAGLDARAYRMPELSTSVAFEVDHPATQAFKLRQVAGLRPCVRELRHVAADLTHERLGDVLAGAGHDMTIPTAWVFEGVITYLTTREVEASIEAMSARSAPGSRLLATYNEPNWRQALFGRFMVRIGERPRASFTPEQMRKLLFDRGFVVRSDRDGRERARRWGARSRNLGGVRFHHVVIADR
jgi:methyltransferase (TIGR00027 family)